MKPCSILSLVSVLGLIPLNYALQLRSLHLLTLKKYLIMLRLCCECAR